MTQRPVTSGDDSYLHAVYCGVGDPGHTRPVAEVLAEARAAQQAGGTPEMVRKYGGSAGLNYLMSAILGYDWYGDHSVEES